MLVVLIIPLVTMTFQQLLTMDLVICQMVVPTVMHVILMQVLLVMMDHVLTLLTPTILILTVMVMET